MSNPTTSRRTRAHIALGILIGAVGVLFVEHYFLTNSPVTPRMEDGLQSGAGRLGDSTPGLIPIESGRQPTRLDLSSPTTEASPGIDAREPSQVGSLSVPTRATSSEEEYSRVRREQLASTRASFSEALASGDKSAYSRARMTMLAAIVILLDSRGQFESLDEGQRSIRSRYPDEFRFASGARLYSFSKSDFAGFAQVNARADALEAGGDFDTSLMESLPLDAEFVFALCAEATAHTR